MKPMYLFSCLVTSLVLALTTVSAQELDENQIRKFLMEVPAASNVEASQCWNEDLFRLLEQKNYIVIDVMGTLDYDILSRVMEHLRNPIHDGIDVEKIYHDIKAARPQAQSVINAVFDAVRKTDISMSLQNKHVMRTISYVSHYDCTRMRYSDKTKKGKREHYHQLQRVMDQLAYEGILNAQNDEITLFAGISHISGNIDKVIVKCNDGLYIAYVGHAICTPFKKIDAVDEFVNEYIPVQFFGETYVKNQRNVLGIFFSGNMEAIISTIKSLGHPANYELYMEYLWKIAIENGKVVSDELVVFDPLYLN